MYQINTLIHFQKMPIKVNIIQGISFIGVITRQCKKKNPLIMHATPNL